MPMTTQQEAFQSQLLDQAITNHEQGGAGGSQQQIEPDHHQHHHHHQSNLFDEFDDNPTPIITQLLAGNSTNNSSSVSIQQQQQHQQQQNEEKVDETAKKEKDYVDVDEIDDSMEELLALSHKFMNSSIVITENNTNNNNNHHYHSSETIGEQLKNIYDTLFHAIYDCSSLNNKNGEENGDGDDDECDDPVPYALIVELQRQIDNNRDEIYNLLHGNSKNQAEQEMMMNMMMDNLEMKPKLKQVDQIVLREELNKVRKRSLSRARSNSTLSSPVDGSSPPSSPISCSSSVLHSNVVVVGGVGSVATTAGTPLSSPVKASGLSPLNTSSLLLLQQQQSNGGGGSAPNSPTSSGRRLVVDAQVIQNVARKSFGQVAVITAEELLNRKVEKLVRRVTEQRSLSKEEEEQLNQELRNVLEKYNK